MRKEEDILNNPLLKNFRDFGMFKAGTVTLPIVRQCSVIFSDNEEGWEHVSVSPKKKDRIPSWKDMCVLKDIFWGEEEEVYQIHPKKSEYVNISENCLHLWKPIHGELKDLGRK